MKTPFDTRKIPTTRTITLSYRKKKRYVSSNIDKPNYIHSPTFTLQHPRYLVIYLKFLHFPKSVKRHISIIVPRKKKNPSFQNRNSWIQSSQQQEPSIDVSPSDVEDTFGARKSLWPASYEDSIGEENIIERCKGDFAKDVCRG